MDESAKFYETELRKNADVVATLKKGMMGETAKSFGVGFAPAGWRNLYDYLKDKGWSDSEMEKKREWSSNRPKRKPDITTGSGAG